MSVTLDPQTSEYLNLWQDLSSDEKDLVLKGMRKIVSSQTDASQENNLVEAITGRTWTQSEKVRLELESLSRYFQRRRELLQNTITASEVAKLLGTTRQTPHDRLKSNTLLGVRDNGVYRFPVWQFDPEAPDSVIEGLPEVLKALQVSDFAKLNWLARPSPYLDGLTPVEALKQGQKERVVTEAIGVRVL